MREWSKPKLKKIIAISAVLLLLIGVVTVWQYALGDHSPSSPEDTELVSSDSTTSEPEEELPPDSESEADNDKSEVEPSDPDPSSFSSLTISQMDLEVFYSKGVPGFSYQILRTPAGTQYVEFSSEDIAGTKCTDDEGVFASIIKNPSAAEESTVTATTKIDLDSYGLSLASGTCTADPDLLSDYQAAFKNGFGSLRLAED